MRSAAAFDHDAAVRRGEVPRRPRRELLEEDGRRSVGERTPRDQEEERQGGGRREHPNRFLLQHDPGDNDFGRQEARGARRGFDQEGGRSGRNAGGYGDGQGGRGAMDDWGGGGRRDEPYGRRSDVGIPKAHYLDVEEPPAWEYLDPSNVVQGPFSSEKLWTWYSDGYLPDTLQVREAGMDIFVSLKSVSHMVKQYVVASPPPPRSPQGAGRGRVPAVAAVRNDGPGEGRVGARRAVPYSRELYDANRGAHRAPGETIKCQPREVPKVHPAYSCSEEQRKYEEVQQETARRTRGGVQQCTATAAEPPSRGGPSGRPRTSGRGVGGGPMNFGPKAADYVGYGQPKAGNKAGSVVQEPAPPRRTPPRAAAKPQQVTRPRAIPINPAPVSRARPASFARAGDRQEPNRADPGAEARRRGRGRGAAMPARAEPYVAGQRDGGAASMEECLPRDVLEAIMGKLDVNTLCTAHQVSRTFCAAASANISTLTLRRLSLAHFLERFPRLDHMRVCFICNFKNVAELDPPLCAVITELRLYHIQDCVRMMLPELPGMAKLRELAIDMDGQVDGAEVLHRLTNLEVLRIGQCTPPVAMAITTMTLLTLLVIGLVTRPGEGWQSAEYASLRHATHLRRLQALQLSISHEAFGLIGNLTGLTGLTWLGNNPETLDAGQNCSIAPLSRLSRLRCLDIAPQLSESNVAIACSLGLGSLAELGLRASFSASADCGRLLARQTALERLRVGGAHLYHLRHMGALRMELLQFLELQCFSSLGAPDLGCPAESYQLDPAAHQCYVHQASRRGPQSDSRAADATPLSAAGFARTRPRHEGP